MLERIKASFGLAFDTMRYGYSRVATVKRTTSDQVSVLGDMTDFKNMDDATIRENIFVFDPDVGAGIDHMATLVRSSYKGVTVTEDANVNEPLIKKMLEDAKDIERIMNPAQMFETDAEMLLMHGDEFKVINPDLSLTILPNKMVTILDDRSKIRQASTQLITQENYLVFGEKPQTAIPDMDYTVYAKKDFIHIKYKDTPIFSKDYLGRVLWGIYSASPMQRVILSVWRKRYIEMIDTLLRQKSVPREHHKIKSDLFAIGGYAGSTIDAKRTNSTKAANAQIGTYIDDIKDIAPDQNYVTLDTTEIDIIEPKSTFLDSNKAIEQIVGTVYAGLGVPPSMVNGKGAGSYASELVISNYVSSKVINLAHKIKPHVLDIMKRRLLKINSNYPVDKLDIKTELAMATSQLELLRAMAIMGSIGIFTEDELRDIVSYLPLDEDMRAHLVNTSNKNTTNTVVSNQMQGDGSGELRPPDTPSSDAQHTRDPAQNTLRDF